MSFGLFCQSTGIRGVTYRLAQGVVKHIIPAVASTNAVIAAACALEVFKLASCCAPKLDNYMVFNDTDGKFLHYAHAGRSNTGIRLQIEEKKKMCIGMGVIHGVHWGTCPPFLYTNLKYFCSIKGRMAEWSALQTSKRVDSSSSPAEVKTFFLRNQESRTKHCLSF